MCVQSADRTGGVVGHGPPGTGAGRVVGKHGGEVGEAAGAGEGAGRARGVAVHLDAVVALHEHHVEVSHGRQAEGHPAAGGPGLLHPDALRRTRVWGWWWYTNNTTMR